MERGDGSPERASGGADILLQRATEIIRRSASSPKNGFIVDLVADRASLETWRVHHARYRVPITSAVAGRTRLHWGRRERQPDGSAAGGPSAFFSGNSIVLGSALQPTIRLHLMRDPVIRPPRTTAVGTRRPFRAPETLRDRASGVRGGWVRCASGRHRRRGDNRDEHEGPLKIQENSHGPSLRPHHPPDPTFHAGCPTRNEEALHRLGECRRTTAEQRRSTITPPACNQIDEEPKNADGSLPHSISLPFPTPPGIVPRRPPRHASAHYG